jgi:hypothetical protein
VFVLHVACGRESLVSSQQQAASNSKQQQQRLKEEKRISRSREKLTIAIMQPQLNVLIHLLNHPQYTPQRLRLDILKPRLLIRALPKRSIDSKINLNTQLLSPNRILEITHCTEKSSLIDLKPSLAILVLLGDDDAGACWEADLEPDVLGDDAFVLEAFESGVAWEGGGVVACFDAKGLDFVDVDFGLGCWDVYCLGRFVHFKRIHTLRQGVKDRELESSKVRAIACFAVWNALQATGQACDAFAEDGFGVGEEDAAYEVAAAG